MIYKVEGDFCEFFIDADWDNPASQVYYGNENVLVDGGDAWVPLPGQVAQYGGPMGAAETVLGHWDLGDEAFELIEVPDDEVAADPEDEAAQ